MTGNINIALPQPNLKGVQGATKLPTGRVKLTYQALLEEFGTCEIPLSAVAERFLGMTPKKAVEEASMNGCRCRRTSWERRSPIGIDSPASNSCDVASCRRS